MINKDANDMAPIPRAIINCQSLANKEAKEIKARNAMKDAGNRLFRHQIVTATCI